MITMIMKKYYECKVKLAVYKLIADTLDNKKDLIHLAKHLIVSMKDTPAEELQEKLIAAISELAHFQAVREREAKKAES